jgi:hypothetical protein
MYHPVPGVASAAQASSGSPEAPTPIAFGFSVDAGCDPLAPGQGGPTSRKRFLRRRGALQPWRARGMQCGDESACDGSLHARSRQPSG